MNFNEIIDLFKAGKPIRRKSWNKYFLVIKNDSVFGYLQLENGNKAVEKHPIQDRIFTAEDIMANDWELI